VTGGAQTAQDAYRTVMRDRVAPALRQMGFKGSSGKFHMTQGDYRVRVDALKSRWNTKDEVEFTFDLGVAHIPSPKPNGVWWQRLGHLLPGGSNIWWKIDATTSPDEIADSVIRALKHYGWPAIEAVLQGSELPQARATPAPRLVMSWEDAAELHRRRMALGERIQVCSVDELFDLFRDPFSRWAALDQIGRRAIEDPRSIPVLMQALQSDDAGDRRIACNVLTHLKGHSEADPLLRAATLDDDPDVRWNARYALLLRSGEAPAPVP